MAYPRVAGSEGVAVDEIAEGLDRLAGLIAEAIWHGHLGVVASRSPTPDDAGTPRPRTRNVRPDLLPAGTLTVTGPSRVGTLTCAPRVASREADGHGHGEVFASPAPNTGWRSVCTTT